MEKNIKPGNILKKYVSGFKSFEGLRPKWRRVHKARHVPTQFMNTDAIVKAASPEGTYRQREEVEYTALYKHIEHCKSVKCILQVLLERIQLRDKTNLKINKIIKKL